MGTIGVKTGGRKKGTPNRVTLERAKVIAEENKKSGRMGMVTILCEQANQHHQLAMMYAPHRDRSKDKEPGKFPADEGKFNKHSQIAIGAASHAAQFETPKLQSTTLRNDAPDEPLKVQIEIV